MKNFISLLLIIPLITFTLKAQTIVYANAQTNSISGFCALCSISSPSNAVDGNTGTSASFVTTVGVGATLRMNLTFPSAGNSSDIICLGLGSASGINVSALSSVSFVVKNGGTTVATFTSSSLFAINPLTGSIYAVYIYPNTAFDEVDIKLNYTAGALSQLDIYFASYSAYILDIALNSFTAAPGTNNVLLSWTAENETEGNSFLLERSPDGVNFEPITIITAEAQGALSGHYTYTDNLPEKGHNYYQLKETGVNGLIDESDIIHTFVKGRNSSDDITVFVSPEGEMQVSGISVMEGINTLSIFNSSGQLVSQLNSRAEAGRIYLQKGLLLPGIYFLRLLNRTTSVTCEFKL